MNGASPGPAARVPGREWGVMVLLLGVVVCVLYAQARASRARLQSLDQQAGEISAYFNGIKPQYDTAYGVCDQLTRMAATDRDAAWILQKHQIRIDPQNPPPGLQ